MNIKKIFRNLVVLDLSLFLLMIPILIYQSQSVVNFNNENQIQNEVIFDIILVIWLIAFLVCLYFLYNFKSFGKQLYFFLFILGIVLNLMSGPVAFGAVFYIVDGLSWTNSGAILCLLYFSPIKKEFDKKS